MPDSGLSLRSFRNEISTATRNPNKNEFYPLHQIGDIQQGRQRLPSHPPASNYVVHDTNQQEVGSDVNRQKEHERLVSLDDDEIVSDFLGSNIAHRMSDDYSDSSDENLSQVHPSPGRAPGIH
eukprot:gene172-976_t